MSVTSEQLLDFIKLYGSKEAGFVRRERFCHSMALMIRSLVKLVEIEGAVEVQRAHLKMQSNESIGPFTGPTGVAN